MYSYSEFIFRRVVVQYLMKAFGCDQTFDQRVCATYDISIRMMMMMMI